MRNEAYARRILQQRIRKMAGRWGYSKEEYEWAIADAKEHPEAWAVMCDQDERKADQVDDDRPGPGEVDITYPGLPEPRKGAAYWNEDC